MEHDGRSAAIAWAATLEASAFGEVMRQSTWLYPIANLLHLLGLTLLVGAMVLLDLRLLGTARSVPLAPFSRFLTPVAIAGLTIMLASGFSLFAADGAPLAGNPIFQIKAAIIALGIANALTFRALWRRSLPSWDQHPPALGRAQAALSLALWCSAATAGRLIAYF